MTPRGCLAIDSGAILRQLRLRGWTQGNLAVKMGVHDSAISRCLRHGYARVATIKRIANALDVVPSAILDQRTD